MPCSSTFSGSRKLRLKRPTGQFQATAIVDEDWEAFQRAFDEAVDSANAWHEKKEKPHIRWKLPDHPPPDLDLKPRR